ncbi:hypothetical protein Taro_050472 [Colocasia esculenta]|uniref:Bifunctional inhibitor/plant lipid transfer protein/seed storage helical domain-containing protein n=1 Tax=Colocasia esculenta TaxID=4460 RepID=A0A843XE31_COLES|nr:hypothetical protein [Colocasia esculenta]
MGSSEVSLLAVVVMAVAVISPKAAAQISLPPCLQKLLTCSNFISLTTPPSEACCNPLREAVQNDLPCLCDLLNRKDLIEQFKINYTRAVDLPRRCGIGSNTSICNSATNATAPTTSRDAGAAVGVRMGASGLLLLVAFWWSLLA